MDCILDKIEMQKLKWFEHVIHMDNTKPVKIVWAARVQHVK